MRETQFLIFFVAVCLSLCAYAEGKIWALLVAGSNYYDNYRHQADICHAYQILKHYGIPEENIITMMYDDIANNSKNPTPGVIINQPEGKNVYEGVVKDYTHETVTPKNFINVLTGNNAAMKGIGSGRVIESGPDDIVFVNFVDHGGPGVLCFPAEDLTVKDLNTVLKKLVQQKKFKKLILYVEACYSGSMFDGILVDNTNIFVMTAADPNESSYACYYDEYRETYLGDSFSVNWMQESEKENIKAHSLNHIFEKVRTLTENLSHVEEYGDLDIGSTLISDVFGDPRFGFYDVHDEKSGMKRFNVESIMDQIVLQLSRNNTSMSIRLRNSLYSINKENIDCYDVVVKEFSKTCFKISQNPFVTTQLHVLINACSLYKNNENKIIRDIQRVCRGLQPMTNIV